MPRYTKRQHRQSTQERVDRYSVLRGLRTNWVDPFPHIQGTLPEKYVYAELSRRGIKFAFQNEIRFIIPEIKLVKDYRPDIVIPSLKVIIEVQGYYWHTKEGAIDSDAYKFAVYKMTGWRVIAWWDFDILARLQDLFAADAQLSKYPPIGYQAVEYVYTKKITRNDSKGIVTMNRKRGQRYAYKRPAPRVRMRK